VKSPLDRSTSCAILSRPSGHVVVCQYRPPVSLGGALGSGREADTVPYRRRSSRRRFSGVSRRGFRLRAGPSKPVSSPVSAIAVTSQRDRSSQAARRDRSLVVAPKWTTRTGRLARASPKLGLFKTPRRQESRNRNDETGAANGHETTRDLNRHDGFVSANSRGRLFRYEREEWRLRRVAAEKSGG